MKKLLLVAVTFMFAAPAFAQATLYEGFFDAPMQRSVHNALEKVFSHQSAAPWVAAVRAEQQKVSRPNTLGTSMYGIPSVFYANAPKAELSALYIQRQRAFDNLLQTNHTLKAYKFRAPRPTDLTELTQTQLTFLANFLAQPVQKELFNALYTPRVSKTHDAVTQLEFACEKTKLFFVINSRDNIVYFFAHAVPQPTVK